MKSELNLQPSTFNLQLATGRSLRVETCGPQDGPAVTLLHQGLGAARGWKEQIPALAAAGFRVIAYDRWGYGGSSPRPQISMPGFEEDREDLAALLDALGLSRTALVGHSDGGTIALYFAADHPERVTRLVAVAAHIYIEPKMKEGIAGVRRAFETEERFREALREAHGEKAGAVFYNWYSAWWRPENISWDMRPELKKIACPVLVVQGLEDEHATPQHARDIAAAIPHAELWLEPGAAHMLPMERPEKFNERLLKFLKDENRR